MQASSKFVGCKLVANSKFVANSAPPPHRPGLRVFGRTTGRLANTYLTSFPTGDPLPMAAWLGWVLPAT
eukprot:9669601-Prorocentrum_lima.AAC.1